MTELRSFFEIAGIDVCVVDRQGNVSWRSPQWDLRWNDGQPTQRVADIVNGLTVATGLFRSSLVDSLQQVASMPEPITLKVRCDTRATERKVAVTFRRLGEGTSVTVSDITAEWADARQRLATEDLAHAVLETRPGPERMEVWLSTLCAHFETDVGACWVLNPASSTLEMRSVTAGYERTVASPLRLSTQLAAGDSLARSAWLASTLVVSHALPNEDLSVAAALLDGKQPASGWAVPFGGRGPDSGVFVFYLQGKALPHPSAIQRLHAVLSPQGLAPPPVAKPATTDVFELAHRSDSSVLLLGETGVGKTWHARKIHDASHRASKPFIELNCAGLSSTLLESELFGHEKGSFTGAVARKPGLFEAAEGGTVFLDEVGELDPLVQAKLLKVLETRRLRRVGGSVEVPVDFRLMCATNRDLQLEVEAGRFRSDLYFRIHVLELRVPPLRARPWDIGALAAELLLQLRATTRQPRLSLGDDAVAALVGHTWPGNVRELRNTLERAALLTPDGIVRAEHVLAGLSPPTTATPSPRSSPSSLSSPSRISFATPAPKTDVERTLVVETFANTGRNLSETARQLGVPRTTLRTWLRRFGVLV